MLLKHLARGLEVQISASVDATLGIPITCEPESSQPKSSFGLKPPRTGHMYTCTSKPTAMYVLGLAHPSAGPPYIVLDSTSPPIRQKFVSWLSTGEGK